MIPTEPFASVVPDGGKATQPAPVASAGSTSEVHATLASLNVAVNTAEVSHLASSVIV